MGVEKCRDDMKEVDRMWGWCQNSQWPATWPQQQPTIGMTGRVQSVAPDLRRTKRRQGKREVAIGQKGNGQGR